MISARTKAALSVVAEAIAASSSWISHRSGRPITRLGNPHLKPGDPPPGARRARTANRHFSYWVSF